METIPLRRTCPTESLPPLSSVADAKGLQLSGVTFLAHPHAGHLSFCEKEPAGDSIDPEFHAIVLVPRALADGLAKRWPGSRLLRVDDPRAVFIDTLEYLQRNDLLAMSTNLPPNPTVSPDARIGNGAVVEAGAAIEPGASVGSNAVIHAGSWLRRGASVGDGCVIGSKGINAYVGRDGRRRDFPHAAGVIIGENASLGAGCVVVRGILTSTRIGEDSIVGNLCNIGHGAEIGNNAWISVGTMVGGHTRIGAGATIAMGCAIRDNVRIGAGASVGMGSVVTKDVRAGNSVFGNPARTYAAISAGPSR